MATTHTRGQRTGTTNSRRSSASTRAAAERELKRYERRGATARNRRERQVRRSRTRFEKQSDAITSRVEKLVSDAQTRIGSIP